MMRVTAAVLEREGKVLIARRAPGGRRGGLWEFPGGKVEPGEDPRDGLRRELLEELGVEVEVEDLLLRHRHAYEDVTIELSSYRVRLLAGAPQAREHAAVQWVPLERLGEYEFSAADRPTVDRLRAAVP